MAQGPTVNVTHVIDGERFGSFQWAVAIWCGVLVTLDGFDNGAIAFVAPVIAPLWGVNVPAFGPVFGAGLFGLMIGALASGPIADRFGRKSVVLASTMIFGVFALATVWAQSINELYLLRFLTGIGVGGLMPNSIALTAEYAPKRIRNTVTAVMFLGFALGAGGGGFVGAALIPSFGWQSLFIIGGVLPLLLWPIALFVLPESIRFLVARGGRPTEVARLLNRLTKRSGFQGNENFVIAEETLRGFSVRHLFTEGRAVNTALLWVVFFCNLLVMYFLTNWLPTILREAQVPLGTALTLSGVLPWGGILSTLILGPIVDRIGAPPIVTTLYVCAAAMVIAIGLVGGNIPMLWVTIIAAGACIIGGQSFINVMAAVLYPTTIRSTGVGWALGVGRVGAIVGPMIGGVLLAAHFTPKNLFFSIAVPALIAACAMFVLGRRLRHTGTPATVEALAAQ
jgi:AAHS family 4-hydroxybenzoate transporter-like MFS transporter